MRIVIVICMRIVIGIGIGMRIVIVIAPHVYGQHAGAGGPSQTAREQ